jgi:hypothetical protein
MEHPTSNWEQTLIGYGIEVGLLVSGFFGALLMVGRRGAQRVIPTIVSILAGTACANYLTPIVLHFAPISIQEGRGKYAAAFMMGFLGLKGLELIVDKWFGDKGVNAMKENSERIRKHKASSSKTRKNQSHNITEN